MISRLIEYFREFSTLTTEETDAITESATIRTYPKGSVLLEEGQISRECYFVLEGCVRQYYLVAGEEKTSNFFTESQWVISMHSFTEKAPAGHYFACLEDTMLVVGNEEKENGLYARFPKFEMLSRMALGKVLAVQQATQAAYITDTPEQRYEHLLKNQPTLLQRVPQYLLASYIGVTPESLSRIRKRLATRSGADQSL